MSTGSFVFVRLITTNSTCVPIGKRIGASTRGAPLADQTSVSVPVGLRIASVGTEVDGARRRVVGCKCIRRTKLSPQDRVVVVLLFTRIYGQQEVVERRFIRLHCSFCMRTVQLLDWLGPNLFIPSGYAVTVSLLGSGKCVRFMCVDSQYCYTAFVGSPYA